MINAQQLLSYIERIERLNEQAEIVASDTKMVYNEAKSAGFPSIRVFSYESVLHIRWAKY